ncbi:MAG TPA: bifunctional demethylmenaquinone methyltransferase/2-methoxy-6-polyprenyl-1,4-benzoquinol methylase UbiE [Flavobacteriaceae bacterium]|nr:bifunctional demethylmenaquinone methyltransferase/2-methoxy-6-polyprenyl-1,4-benzoquinol methylase UbiE [Flavobacteriaceae bacterium]MCB9213114.1 bifunctional demethylmenaquinone methyltransferase/2-methoxy-6-polyprenyl-1,4-benzoquinol methylase UbiE [Alteromonas sp.]HPF11020.1 bifunctional demethylmenaquinone methyltransferase/2-methoxy-6-polyprenyl-1,4-benzoquinol methylase UbiE [Flavobacteriaceae bacterium]HQU21881.1 bifunctional demethylmenaquinone methyltransferase/2-methoxy-6-polypreny
MKKNIQPYKHSDLSKKKQVEQMFDTISGEYDGLNRIISLGSDVKWRKKVVALVQKHRPQSILDIATGTGDLAIQFAQQTNAAYIVGLDLSEGMLQVAQKKASGSAFQDRLSFVKGDSEALPFESNSFEAITVSFGIRNFENLEQGLQEIYRVLTPKGLFVILETSVPTKFPWKQGYHLYSNGILPIIGKIFSKDKTAYSYLSKSAAVFPFGEALNNILSKIGFIEVENKPQTLGVATIYTATKQ